MKKLIAFFVLSLALITSLGFSQGMSDGSITYTMAIDGPEMDGMAKAMMKDAKTTISFLGKKVRLFTDMGMMQTTVITDGNTNKSVVLMDMMGMKLAMQPEVSDEDMQLTPNAGVKKTGKTKTIAGYSCEEIIVTQEDGQTANLWITDKIKPQGKTDYSFQGVSGFPLEMTMNQDGNTVNMKAISVSNTKPDADEFSTEVPNGYRLMSEEEMNQMTGGR